MYSLTCISTLLHFFSYLLSSYIKNSYQQNWSLFENQTCPPFQNDLLKTNLFFILNYKLTSFWKPNPFHQHKQSTFWKSNLPPFQNDLLKNNISLILRLTFLKIKPLPFSKWLAQKQYFSHIKIQVDIILKTKPFSSRQTDLFLKTKPVPVSKWHTQKPSNDLSQNHQYNHQL